MDWDRIEGNWERMTGSAKQRWGDLTDDDLTEAQGDRERLEGRIEERYGKTEDEARRDVDDRMATH